MFLSLRSLYRLELPLEPLILQSLTITKEKVIDETAFKSSFIGQMINKTGTERIHYCAPNSNGVNSPQNSIQNSEQSLNEAPENNPESTSVRSSLLSANYLFTLVYFTIGNLRNVTFPAWFLPWLQWSIPEVDDKEDIIGKIS